jgi:hypothetical protein
MKKQEELGVKGIRNKEGHNNGFFYLILFLDN